MMTNETVTVELRGMTVTVKDIYIAPADRDVGISEYVEDFTLWDQDGNELKSWYVDLTDTEIAVIDKAASDLLAKYDSDYDDDYAREMQEVDEMLSHNENLWWY